MTKKQRVRIARGALLGTLAVPYRTRQLYPYAEYRPVHKAVRRLRAMRDVRLQLVLDRADGAW